MSPQLVNHSVGPLNDSEDDDDDDDVNDHDDFIFYVGSSILILCLTIFFMSLVGMIIYQRRKISTNQRHASTSSRDVERPEDIEMVEQSGQSASVHESEKKNFLAGLGTLRREYDEWILNEKEKMKGGHQKWSQLGKEESIDNEEEVTVTTQMETESMEQAEFEEMEKSVEFEFVNEMKTSNNELDIIMERDESPKSSFEDEVVPIRHRWASTWTNLVDVVCSDSTPMESQSDESSSPVIDDSKGVIG